jgi:hypothetical protein
MTDHVLNFTNEYHKHFLNLCPSGRTLASMTVQHDTFELGLKNSFGAGGAGSHKQVYFVSG